MKKHVSSFLLGICASLMSGTTLAEGIINEWPEVGCMWPGGCRYTYKIPTPPVGTQWVLELSTSRPVNDRNVWMIGGKKKVAMDRLNDARMDASRWRYIEDSKYRGLMPVDGEIEFWMPFNSAKPGEGNRALLRGRLTDVGK